VEGEKEGEKERGGGGDEGVHCWRNQKGLCSWRWNGGRLRGWCTGGGNGRVIV